MCYQSTKLLLLLTKVFSQFSSEERHSHQQSQFSAFNQQAHTNWEQKSKQKQTNHVSVCYGLYSNRHCRGLRQHWRCYTHKSRRLLRGPRRSKHTTRRRTTSPIKLSLCVVQTKKERKTNSANQAAPCGGILCYAAAAEWVERLLNKTSVVEWRVAS